MKRSFLAWLVVVCLAVPGTMLAATQVVTATGDCAADMASLQAAAGTAAAGDTIQLEAGPNGMAFNLTCASGSVVMNMATPDVTIEGTPGVMLQGPGMNDDFSAAIYARADSITITGVGIENFNIAIGVGMGGATANSVAITNSTLANNVAAVWVRTLHAKALRVTNNRIVIPASPDADASGPSGTTYGIVVGSQCDDLVIAGNTIQGPGRAVQWRSWNDIIDPNAGPEMAIRSAAIWQMDYQPPAAQHGRISDNTVEGVDLGIQASSDSSVVTRNVVTNSGSGVAISNDTNDGVHMISNGVVAMNTVTEDLFGIIVQSGTGNLIMNNDAERDAIAGLIFASYDGASPSTGNIFLLNSGSKSNVSGNQGTFRMKTNDPPAN